MNTTIDADEVFYFFKDFFPGVFSTREVFESISGPRGKIPFG